MLLPDGRGEKGTVRTGGKLQTPHAGGSHLHATVAVSFRKAS